MQNAVQHLTFLLHDITYVITCEKWQCQHLELLERPSKVTTNVALRAKSVLWARQNKFQSIIHFLYHSELLKPVSLDLAELCSSASGTYPFMFPSAVAEFSILSAQYFGQLKKIKLIFNERYNLLAALMHASL